MHVLKDISNNITQQQKNVLKCMRFLRTKQFLFLPQNKMSSLRNNKNIQSAIASAVFVGLRAEHCHVSELHATKFHSDEGLDVFTVVQELQERVAQLTEKL